MKGKSFVFLFIFTPFLINLAMTFLNMFTIPSYMWEANYKEALITLFSRLYSFQSLGMVIVQLSVGFICLKYLVRAKEFYSSSDIRSFKSYGLVVILVVFAFVLFFIEGFVAVMLYYNGNWAYYGDFWRKVVDATPVWARYMNALVAPFTAGVFEEIIWRGYGITKLEGFTSTKKAVMIQAVAFGLWHINPIHVLFTFIIGLVYGIVFVKRRRLLALTIAHIITDLVGFSSWIL